MDWDEQLESELDRFDKNQTASERAWDEAYSKHELEIEDTIHDLVCYGQEDSDIVASFREIAKEIESDYKDFFSNYR